jgi:hypothetical protein
VLVVSVYVCVWCGGLYMCVQMESLNQSSGRHPPSPTLTSPSSRLSMRSFPSFHPPHTQHTYTTPIINTHTHTHLPQLPLEHAVLPLLALHVLAQLIIVVGLCLCWS